MPIFVRFADPTFRGGRFEGNALPVDVLRDLSAYRDIIIDLARHLFLQSHPTRQRVPRGFVESFQLVLRNVEPGSARPVLERLVPDDAPAGLLFPYNDFFAQARDQIENTIRAVSGGRPLPNDFPRALVSQFNQFGKSLRHDEYIELRGPQREAGPRYDLDTRKHLILQNKPEYEASIDLIAELRGGVIDRRQITFRLPEVGLIDATAPESMVQEIFPIVPSQVRLIGSGIFDQNDRLKSIIHIEELTTTEDEILPTPLDIRLDQIRQLGAGWLEPDSAPLDAAVLARFQVLMNEVLADRRVPLPFVYPTPEGDIQAEWSFSAWEVSAVISLRTNTINLHATNLRGEGDQDIQLVLEQPNASFGIRLFIFGLIQ